MSVRLRKECASVAHACVKRGRPRGGAHQVLRQALRMQAVVEVGVAVLLQRELGGMRHGVQVLVGRFNGYRRCEYSYQRFKA